MSSFTKKQIISTAGPLLSALQLDHLFRPFFGGMGHILMFHRVIPDVPKERIHNHLSLEITPGHFEQTIRYFIKNKYAFYSLDQVHQALSEGANGQRFVALTLDDGYKDNYDFVYPVAKKYGVPIAIYVTTNMPDEKAILWWYMLEDMIREKERIEFEWEGLSYTHNCRSRQEKEQAFDEIGTFMKNHATPANLHQLCRCVFGSFAADPLALVRQLTMSWEEIKSLSRDPLVTIGAHTVNHFSLTQMTDAELLFEMDESRKRIEQHIQQKVRHFAYPYGKKENASLREFNMAKKLGFKTAVTTRVANVFPAHQEALTALPRLNINRVSNQHVLRLQTAGFIPFVVHKGKKVITD